MLVNLTPGQPWSSFQLNDKFSEGILKLLYLVWRNSSSLLIPCFSSRILRASPTRSSLWGTTFRTKVGHIVSECSWRRKPIVFRLTRRIDCPESLQYRLYDEFRRSLRLPGSVSFNQRGNCGDIEEVIREPCCAVYNLRKYCHYWWGWFVETPGARDVLRRHGRRLDSWKMPRKITYGSYFTILLERLVPLTNQNLDLHFRIIFSMHCQWHLTEYSATCC